MEPTSKPAGGQPATPRAEASAHRSGALRMSVHIPEGWNPHTELLQIADYARDCGKRADSLLERAEAADADGEFSKADGLRQRARSAISREAMREVNFRVCLLAMRLSGCRITIPAAEQTAEEMLAEIAAYAGPNFGRATEAHAARIALEICTSEAEESLRATLAAIRAEAAHYAAQEAARKAAAALEIARARAERKEGGAL